MEHAKRAKVACKSCHARRVKCDAAATQPCWHCQVRGTPCELIESRRGKYARKRRLGARPQEQVIYSEKVSAPKPRHMPTLQTMMEENRWEHAPSLGQPLTPPTTASRLEDGDPEDDQVRDGPEMLYARMVDSQPSESEPNFQAENARSFYMGESFSLPFVINSIYNNPGQGANVKRHYPIPTSVAEHARDAAEGLKDSDPATISYLEMRGAFSLPPRDVSDELIRVFFKSFHPAYPVFDRQAFCALYRQGRVSFLAIQTIFFLSFTSCSDSLLQRAGYQDRLTARRTCYLRAKALYDMNYEKDKVQLAAVLFLLGFWWEGPEDQKDTWHWLGSAIGLAQTLGMHRSTANSGMPPRHQSMWKRIWWSIYTRDRHAAASLGRPMRIKDEDCDIEMLNEGDFLVDQNFDNQLLGDQHDFHVMYAIEMSKLAVILGKVLTVQFAPRRQEAADNRDSLVQELAELEIRLPLRLRRQPVDESLDSPFWSCMLHACYHHCQILLYRPSGARSAFLSEAQEEKRAMVAADLTTRIAEDLLSAGTLSFGQLHLVPSIFAALSIHAVVIRRKDPIRRQLAENRARQCMLAMSELARSWPVAGWILRLFINLMKKLTGQSVGCDSAPSRTKPDQTGDSGFESPSATVGSGGTSAMQMASGLDNLIHRSLGNDQSSTRVEEWNESQQTDKLLSDVIWAPDQTNFDFDLLFQGQSNGSLPFNFGSLAETAIPEYAPPGI
ncbi:hypothetical protein CDV55_106004 [Aspergillus turcosus]|nr:hypothetical protein CDV55_106004 [Aspergillus turcosus]